MAITLEGSGIAYHSPDPCPDGHDDCVVVVMIGDDYRWHVPPEDVVTIDDDAYCGGCGQIGCTADG